MPGSDSLANEPGSSSGIQQVMGPSSGTSGIQTRSQSRGRAEGAEHRTPLSSGRGVGGASIWTAAAASNSSPSSGGPTEAMVALQQQMEMLLIQNQEQAKRQDALIQLLSSQQQVVAALQGQVQALTVDRSSSRPSATPEVAPVREQVDPGSSSVDIPVGVPVAGGASVDSVHGGRVQFEDDEPKIEEEDENSGEEEAKHSDRPARRNAWAWDSKQDRNAQALELARIQALNRSSDDIVKTLPKFEELGFPRWREKALSIFAQRGCKAVIMSGQDPPNVSPELVSAQRRNAWLLLENSLEKAGKHRIITRDMKGDPFLLWKKLEETYAMAPAFSSADAAKEALLKLRQGSGSTSLLTYLQVFDEQVDVTQDLLEGAHRSILDDASLISHCRDGLNAAHQSISLSLLDIQQWTAWKHALMQRSFVAKLSSFTASGSDASGDRRQSGGRNSHAERAHAAVGNSPVSCYGCGESGHYRKDCPVPGIATKECRTCGTMRHISKACKRAP